MDDNMRRLPGQPHIAKFVPEALARELEFFPMRCSGGVLKIAVAGLLSDEAQEKIRFVVDRDVSESLYPLDVIRRSLDGLYGLRVEQEESIFYWREWRDVQEDGTIVIKVSWYDRFGSHYTGWSEIAPDCPDYTLWTWLLSQEDRFPQIISGEDFEAIREEYQRTTSHE
ncbi:MAG: hypothetical protein U0800_10495 [Isosphaeraceae bacterium]